MYPTKQIPADLLTWRLIPTVRKDGFVDIEREAILTHSPDWRSFTTRSGKYQISREFVLTGNALVVPDIYGESDALCFEEEFEEWFLARHKARR